MHVLLIIRYACPVGYQVCMSCWLSGMHVLLVIRYACPVGYQVYTMHVLLVIILHLNKGMESTLPDLFFIVLFQLQSKESFCSLEMEAGGDALLPTKSTITMQEPCRLLLIQVVSDLPKVLSRYENQLGVLNPRLRVKTLLSNWIYSTEEKFTMSDVEVSQFSSLQAVLDSSPAGSTILIPQGGYYENINISKPLTLVGNSTAARPTKLFGCVTVSSHGVTIKGLSIYPLEMSKPALEIVSSFNVNIYDCLFHQESYSRNAVAAQKAYAISVSDSTAVNFINNFVSNFGTGLRLENCSNCTVRSNLLQSCWNALSVLRCDGVGIIGNLFKDNVLVMLIDKNKGKPLFARENAFDSNLDILSPPGQYSVGTTQDHSLAGGSRIRSKLPMKIIITGVCSADGGSEDNSNDCASFQGMLYCR